MKSVLVIGGTGAQGVPVVKGASIYSDSQILTVRSKTLASGSNYNIRILTRSSLSKEAKELANLPEVTIFEGNTYDEPTLRQAFQGIHCVFANTNGFAIGEKAEIY